MKVFEWHVASPNFSAAAQPFEWVNNLSSLFYPLLKQLLTTFCYHHAITKALLFCLRSQFTRSSSIDACVVTCRVRVKYCTCYVGPRRFCSPFDCIRHLYAVGGARMLFHGAKITVLREAPAFTVYMLTFTGLRRRLNPSGRIHPPLSVDLVAGGVAGLMSWSSTMPIDVVKSRFQSDNPVDRASSGTGRMAARYSGVVDCAVHSWRAEGVSVFYRGLPVTCMRAFPTNAVLLVVYVNVLRLLDG